ncbi:hypothetical protein PVK06_019279 [Gossypium arboreum]|uniref:Uncharacterized protein n=1 Tax=Gossypium arboreum TaxID=29729 RepID=A0ABR0PJJ7_GOSAR|nr:hypothetical protein PVK06_019279 [Gossypium arboreum]
MFNLKISLKISNQNLKIVTPLRSSHILSRLFFADNLVIFGKADVRRARLIKDLLDTFCGYSGHRVNVQKMNTFFSKGVDENLVRHLCDMLGFRKVHNLGLYLGVPLFHDKVIINSLKFVVEKVKLRLQRWDARKLSLADRVPLAQSILLTIPSYFMQSLRIP